MADYELPAYVVSRLRYYDGRFLQAQDFVDEQEYHIDARRRHERLLHVAGILEGLDVTPTAGATGIDVAPGSAVDGEGRQILLPQKQTIATLPGAGTWVVAITFGEDPTDKADENSVIDDHTRFTQSAAPVSLQPALPPGAVLLAEISILAGQVTNVDTSKRAYSGLSLPGPANTGASGSLRSRGDMSPGWVELGCSLRVQGDQTIGGGLSVGGALTVAMRDVLAQIDDLMSRADAFDAAIPALQLQVGPPGPPGPAGPPGSGGLTYNPARVAILRWYDANQTGINFAVGSTPSGIAFDGANMWIVNEGSNSVTKLSPTGTTLGTFAVGANPDGIAFDGVNMWIANEGGSSVTKLSPTGATLGTFSVGGNPRQVAFDGANMWITHLTNLNSDYVTKLSLAGVILGTFATGDHPLGIAFDGANMWVTNYNSNDVTKLSLAGATLGTFATGNNPVGIAFDGANIWIANFGSDNVTKLSSAGAPLGTFAAGSNPKGIAFDGSSIWVVNIGGDNVTKLSTAGAILGTFAVGNLPYGVAFDGANLWVVNSGSNNVTKL